MPGKIYYVVISRARTNFAHEESRPFPLRVPTDDIPPYGVANLTLNINKLSNNTPVATQDAWLAALRSRVQRIAVTEFRRRSPLLASYAHTGKLFAYQRDIGRPTPAHT